MNTPYNPEDYDPDKEYRPNAPYEGEKYIVDPVANTITTPSGVHWIEEHEPDTDTIFYMVKDEMLAASSDQWIYKEQETP